MSSERLSWLTLGTALRRATERFYTSVDAIYAAEAVLFQAAWYPVFRALADGGSMTVSAVATRIGQSHAAVSQVSKKLADAGYLDSAPARDKRQRTLGLTVEGRLMAARLRDVWDAIADSLGAELGEFTGDLLTCIGGMHETLGQEALTTTVLATARRQRDSALELIDMAPELTSGLEHLGLPGTNITEQRIVCARLHNEVIGACTLRSTGDREFELDNVVMAPVCRRLGFGRRLVVATLERVDPGSEVRARCALDRVAVIALLGRVGFVPAEATRPEQTLRLVLRT